MHLIFAIACTPDEAPEPPQDSEAADSGETGNDTAATSPPTVAFDVSGQLNGLAFSLVHLPVTEGGLVMGEVVADLPAAARIELRPDALPYLVPVPDIAGLEGAFFVGGLHEDGGESRWDADERWFAAGSWMALYLSGELPPTLALAGMTLGWNGLLIDGSAVPLIGDPLALPITVTWTEALSLEGTVDDTLPADTRLALVPSPVFAGAAVEELLVDQPLESPWFATVSGAPDPSHLLDLDGDGFPEAVETLVVYADADASGGLTVNDVGLGGVCALEGPHANQSVGLFFSAPSTNVLWPVYSAVAGAGLGWNAFAAKPDSATLQFLAAEDLTGLVASAACTLE